MHIKSYILVLYIRAYTLTQDEIKNDYLAIRSKCLIVSYFLGEVSGHPVAMSAKLEWVGAGYKQ